MKCLLEEMRIELSIVVSDLLGASGLRILQALAEGETDPEQLAALGNNRLRCSEEQLVDALTGRAQPMQREMPRLQLERLQLINTQIAKLNGLIAQAMKPHQGTFVTCPDKDALRKLTMTFRQHWVDGAAGSSEEEICSFVTGKVQRLRVIRS